ncbi:protein asteroid homolog 1-like isoform X2 [Myxocyprinus asiaticus]|uniref:protein asteroid homolog 1-like isoform X2 n=1 Tax=Myxocyprinus asiaticus TaxID=70543 RepID=UPI0022229E11|nr:protein asteroid homolog 1-like isoform X2 [Myxocyprinus asiaticus]
MQLRGASQCKDVHQFCLYFQCKLDQMHGGDYDAFEEIIRKFFENLTACDIRPFVVLDGGADHTDKKFDTLMERSQGKIKQAYALSVGSRGTVLPILIKDVFRQVLHKLKVPLVECLQEADWEIAALAKQWNCPILSNDSDFYIFNLKAGILPITYFQWENVRGDRQTNKKFIPTKHFSVENLCASFKHMNKDLLPLVAAILGNDYMKLQNIRYLRWEQHSVHGGEFARIDGLLHWLSKFAGPEEAIADFLKLITDEEKDIVVKALFEAIKEYKLFSSSLAQFFISKTVPQTSSPLQALPKWTLRPLLEGRMSSYIIDVLVLQRNTLRSQVEDFELPSSNETSRPIRQVLYGVLLLGEQQTEDKLMAAAKESTGTSKCYVDEYDREQLTLTFSKVEAIQTRVKPGIRLETLREEPHNVRLQVLLDTLGVPTVVLKAIPLDLQLQVFVTHYWMVNAQPQPSQVHLWSLLLGMVYGKLCSMPNKQKDTLLSLKKLQIHQGKNRLDHEVAHLYSQWQSCLLWSLHLNRLLCLPLQEPECAWLYRGTLVHQAVRELSRGVTPETLLVSGSYAEQLFRQLKDAVLSLVDKDGILRISNRDGHRTAVKIPNGYRHHNQPIDELSSLFEHFMDEDIEDYDDDDLNGKGRSKAKTEMLECSYTVRTRYKAKSRNDTHPSKKYERRCFE